MTDYLDESARKWRNAYQYQKTLPREPTPEMNKSGWDAAFGPFADDSKRNVITIWQAMYDAYRSERPNSNQLWTERYYPCGCSAKGSGDVPAYCAEHGHVPSTP